MGPQHRPCTCHISVYGSSVTQSIFRSISPYLRLIFVCTFDSLVQNHEWVLCSIGFLIGVVISDHLRSQEGHQFWLEGNLCIDQDIESLDAIGSIIVVSDYVIYPDWFGIFQ